MILTIDVGNTRVKWVLFQGEAISGSGAFEYLPDSFKECFIKAGLKLEGIEVVVSSVMGGRVEKILTQIFKSSKCKRYAYAQTQVEQCGVINSYADASRLGVDRWLAMIAGFNHAKRAQGESVCIIDCGTAMTLDVVDASGHHLGGVITPGYRLMQSMLFQQTNGIYELDANTNIFEMNLANTTDDAVRQGCVQLLVGGLSNMVSRYSENNKDKMCCIVTGGDAGWVTNLLEIEVVHEPVLVNQGLWFVSKELLKD